MSDRRERQKQARAAAKEAQRKATARRELRRRITVGLGLGASVAVMLLLLGTFSSDEGDLPEALADFRDQPTACGGSLPDPVTEMQFESPVRQVFGSDSVVATLETSCGTIVVELAAEDFPQTVSSFVFLARNGYYDGTAFHRIATDFVIQGGDPTATGAGGPGYSIPDEFPDTGFLYEEGVVAMANGGRGTTGSQFFIVTGDEAELLNPTFNVLGRVVEGFDVLERINQVETRQQAGGRERSYPTESVYLNSVTITG
ncbi:MAG: peptidylprolyl isomerase [Acidimicrobiia bacterium]